MRACPIISARTPSHPSLVESDWNASGAFPRTCLTGIYATVLPIQNVTPGTQNEEAVQKDTDHGRVARVTNSRSLSTVEQDRQPSPYGATQQAWQARPPAWAGTGGRATSRAAR